MVASLASTRFRFPGRGVSPRPGSLPAFSSALGLGEYEEYHPYGSTAWWAEKSGIQVSRKRYRYTGMERDEETGLQVHHHRYYMPWLGRWASADPAGLVDGVNRYVYARGSPAGGRDPSGLAILGKDFNASAAHAEAGRAENLNLLASALEFVDEVRHKNLTGIVITELLGEDKLSLEDTAGALREEANRAQQFANLMDPVAVQHPVHPTDFVGFAAPLEGPVFAARAADEGIGAVMARLRKGDADDLAEEVIPVSTKIARDKTGAEVSKGRVVIQGAADVAHEAAQARRFGELEGGGSFRFLGDFSQGIEGFFTPTGSTQAIPVSMKDFTGIGRLPNIIARINRNAAQVSASGNAGNTVLHATVNATVEQMEAFVRGGPLAGMPSEGVFSRLIFQASDGVVEVNPPYSPATASAAFGVVSPTIQRPRWPCDAGGA